MRKCITLLLMVLSQLTFSQNIKYSFASTEKGYQEKGVNESKLDNQFWKETDTKVTISEDKCLVVENGITREFQVLSSELKRNPTRILIKALKSRKKYDLELMLLRKGEFFFYIQDFRLTEIYKTNKLIKTK